jgi:cytochrome oxidase assembly protein ShyY1
VHISDIDFGIHRQRSSTAQRLEKMDQDRKKTNRIKHVKWEWSPVVLTGRFVNLFIVYGVTIQEI